MTTKTELSIHGMTCAGCVSHVTRALQGVDGVSEASVNLASERATIVHEPGVASGALIAAVERAGYEAQRPASEDEDARRRDAELARKRRLLMVAVALFVPTLVLGMFVPEFSGKSWVLFALTLPVWAVVGWEFHSSALSALRSGTTTMDTLVSLGSTAAFALSTYQAIVGTMTYFETASAIVTLIFVGKYLELAARSRSNRAIRALLELRPQQAHRRTADGRLETVPIDVIETGDLLAVAAGERIPVDGVVVEGESGIDRSLLTGESMPVSVHPGDAVSQGTINGDGALVVRARAVGEGTELARIIDIVRAAQGSTPPVQRLADRVAGVFVPIVLVVSLLTFAGWVVTHHTWSDAFVAAIAVLVVACPCALGLATPTAVIAGVGASARHGILFKDASSLERAAHLDTIVFDKTGTLTRGTPEVHAVHAFEDTDERSILELAAAVERKSTHPLAHAIVQAADARGIGESAASDVRAERGAGIEARINGSNVLVGTRALLESRGIAVPQLASDGATRAYVARDGRATGAIDITDAPRDDAREAVESLRALGVEVALVSGDADAPVRAVAEHTGISTWRAQTRPEEKAAFVRDLAANGRHTGFVGDGINDAPALASADVGFAMGGGAAVALETAHAAILSNDPASVAQAVRLARATMRTIRQNLFWAFAYNVVLVPLAAFGIVQPVFAAAAMGLSSLFVVGNSLLFSRR